ncbi:APC family permease [Streptomyces sp. NPDC004610]|uniref:APC family permease n=1 Tax=unclassified Streptomyces TaxID=2593676 RepID=UPI0033B8630A
MQKLSGSGKTLTRGAVGVPGMLFMVLAATAPLTALSANFTLTFALGAGVGTVGVIIVVAALLAIYTVGYLAMARTVVNSGAYYAYIEHGLGKVAGAASAMVATVQYNAGAVGMAVLSGYFTDGFMESTFGVDLPWWLYAAVAVAATAVLGHLGVSIASKVTAAVCLLQFAIVLALMMAVLVDSRASYSTAVFSPDHVFGSHIGLSILFILLAFAGYEASACYSEEAGDAAKQVAWATYLALGGLTVLFVAAAWTIVASVGDVATAAQTDPAGLIAGVATTHLGDWVGPVLTGSIAVSFFGATVSVHTIASRYLFSLGRAGLLPRALSSVHPRRGTPHHAHTTQVVVVVAFLIPFAVGGLDPLLSLLPALGGVTALGLLTLMILCSASVVVSAARGTLSGSLWSTRIAPGLSFLALSACTVVIVANYPTVTGSDSALINSMPVVLVLGAVTGAALAWRRQHPARPVTLPTPDGPEAVAGP